MNPGRAILTVLFTLGFSFAVTADPVNFMVGDFTFLRPAAWKWEEIVSQSKAAAQLRIVEEKTGDQSQVLISFSSATRDDVTAKWKRYFADSPPIVHSIVSKKIKSHSIIWITVDGTYRYKGVPKPEYTLLGAIIETEKGNVFGRLIGPKAMVKSSSPTFKKMIEDAVKEE